MAEHLLYDFCFSHGVQYDDAHQRSGDVNRQLVVPLERLVPLLGLLYLS